jgi:hypothetical protein
LDFRKWLHLGGGEVGLEQRVPDGHVPGGFDAAMHVANLASREPMLWSELIVYFYLF